MVGNGQLIRCFYPGEGGETAVPSTQRSYLSITNLKKYFPVAKATVFQKTQQYYVKANEDISLDIYEGETHRRRRRVRLRQDPRWAGCCCSSIAQTAGSTMYYGKTLAEVAPSYMEDTLRHLDKYRQKYKKAQEKAAELNRKVEEIGEDKADFYLLQDRNLARCDEQTCLDHMVKIVGGFFAVDDNDQGRQLILREYEASAKRAQLSARRLELSVELEHRKGSNAGGVEKLEEKIKALDSEIAAQDQQTADVEASLTALRQKYADNPEFAKYEAMRDDGVDLSRLKYKEQRALRKDLQIIFQDPYSSLNPRFTIGQIIEEGLVTHHFYKHGSEAMRQYIIETMEKCGLQDYMLHRYPHQFSGGQRQRICIARALAVQPKFIVCDECVSALDVSIQSQIINLLQELKEKENLTYMFISHDLSVVRYISDRICVMYLGNVVELADAETIFRDPRHPYTVALLSSIPTTDPDSLDKERILLEGNIPSPIKPPSGCKFHTRCYMACDKCKRVPPELREVEPGHFLACHFPEKKLDENGNYLFELPKMEKKSNRTAAQEPQA